MPDPVTSADVRTVVDGSIDALAGLPDDAWDRPAEGMDWTCREVVAHVLDDLGAYAMQLSGERGHGTSYVPLTEAPYAGPDRLAFLFWPELDGGTTAIVQSLDAVGGLLVAVVATVPPDRRGWHPFGTTDGPGLAAMGITETALHTWDILRTFGVEHRADAAVVGRVLDRIFPDAVRTGDAWPDLLAATGRTPSTHGLEWRWDSSVRP